MDIIRNTERRHLLLARVANPDKTFQLHIPSAATAFYIMGLEKGSEKYLMKYVSKNLKFTITIGCHPQVFLMGAQKNRTVYPFRNAFTSDFITSCVDVASCFIVNNIEFRIVGSGALQTTRIQGGCAMRCQRRNIILFVVGIGKARRTADGHGVVMMIEGGYVECVVCG